MSDDLVETAVDLARELHRHDVRKGSEIPYFEGHLEPVAGLVREHGGTDAQIAVAYLHDAAEDAGGRQVLARIADEVDPQVAAMVEALSDSLVDTTGGAEKADWATRKTGYIDRLADAPRQVLEVAVADKVHNATSVLDDYDELGEQLWARFTKREAEYQLWYYDRLVSLFADRLGEHPLTDRLERTVAALRARVRATVPGIDHLVEGVARAVDQQPASPDPAADETWAAAHLLVPGDDARTACYRRLQSWWRHDQLAARPGPAGQRAQVGSSLHPDDVDRQPDLNFLHPNAYHHARQRAAEVAAEGGTLDPDRLRRNLLSSMPLCFNLFGTLAGHPRALAVVQAAIDPDAARITQLTCEWAPQPPEHHLGDRTAFDAHLRYLDRAGNARFAGIETKYTEPFSPTEHDRPRYRELTAACGWFRDPERSADRLVGAETNQLWRQVLLCASVEAGTEAGRGAALVVCPADDARAAAAVEKVRAELVDPDRLRLVTLEELVAACAGAGGALARFAGRFANRYLHPDRPHQAERGGPRLGRPLTAP